MTTNITLPMHGWRVTWPMVQAWLVTAVLFIPYFQPYLDGTKTFTTAAILPLFAVIVAHLTHSPSPSDGAPAIGTKAVAVTVEAKPADSGAV